MAFCIKPPDRASESVISHSVAGLASVQVVLHVCAIVFAPMLLAFVALLSIGRVFGHFLAVVVGAPSSLTAGSITNLLIGMVGRRQETFSTVGTSFFRHVFKLADCRKTPTRPCAMRMAPPWSSLGGPGRRVDAPRTAAVARHVASFARGRGLVPFSAKDATSGSGCATAAPHHPDPRAAYAIYSPADRAIEFRRVAMAGGKILAAGFPNSLASRLAVGN